MELNGSDFLHFFYYLEFSFVDNTINMYNIVQLFYYMENKETSSYSNLFPMGCIFLGTVEKCPYPHLCYFLPLATTALNHGH